MARKSGWRPLARSDISVLAQPVHRAPAQVGRVGHVDGQRAVGEVHADGVADRGRVERGDDRTQLRGGGRRQRGDQLLRRGVVDEAGERARAAQVADDGLVAGELAQQGGRGRRLGRARLRVNVTFRSIHPVLHGATLPQAHLGCTASIAPLHVGQMRRARGQELVGLVVGHRPLGEEGEERRAAVGDAGRARLGLGHLALDVGLRARPAPRAALGRGVQERRVRVRRERSARPTGRARRRARRRRASASGTNTAPASASGTSAYSTGTSTFRPVPSL